MKWIWALACAAAVVTLTPSVATADAVGVIENARAKERQGRYLNWQDREQLRRWGGGESYGRRYYGYRAYDYGYYDGYYDHGPVYYYRSYPY